VLLLHQKVTINGVRNIETNDILEIGIKPRGFLHKSDKTYLNIKGKLKIKGLYSIGRGCRFDIGENAIVSIGSGGYMTSNVTLIIMHNLIIGDNCAIAWNIQFLDDNFHTIEYAGKKESKNSIEIGNNVWIGCGVKIYKGTIIPNGCVIASDSIVKGSYLKENCLIAGNPAKIIKENVKWDDKELPS
jgi:acetyltransferase-like isoleucine patch superfamily enzyme